VHHRGSVVKTRTAVHHAFGTGVVGYPDETGAESSLVTNLYGR